VQALDSLNLNLNLTATVVRLCDSIDACVETECKLGRETERSTVAGKCDTTWLFTENLRRQGAVWQFGISVLTKWQMCSKTKTWPSILKA